MSDRRSQISDFIATTPWATSSVAPLAGDASLRKYLRIGQDVSGRPAVLMDADPALGNDVGPFIQITTYLRSIGLSAPEIYAEHRELGLLLIEDLGDSLFARVAQEKPDLEETLYEAAIDVLLHLHKQPPPKLSEYNASVMTDLAVLSYDWYAFGITGETQTAKRDAFAAEFQKMMAKACMPSVLIQRDYHAENLLWLPQRNGPARVGLLDYQDALLGHPAYDLVSLLKDARRDVAPELETAMIARYTSKADMDAEQFQHAYHLLGLQRNLRILGVFARLSMHFGKPSYIDFIPRVWEFVERDLGTDACQPLADMVLSNLPEPTPDRLQKLRDLCGTIPTL